MAKSPHDVHITQPFQQIMSQQLSDSDRKTLEDIFTKAMDAVDHHRDILRQEIINICNNEKQPFFWYLPIVQGSAVRRGQMADEIVMFAVYGNYGWNKDSLKNPGVSETIVAFEGSKIKEAAISAIKSQQRGDKGVWEFALAERIGNEEEFGDWLYKKSNGAAEHVLRISWDAEWGRKER